MLKAIAEGLGITVSFRFFDVIKPPQEEKTGDEVALEVIRKLGLEVKA